jgi:hypothetical protein
MPNDQSSATATGGWASNGMMIIELSCPGQNGRGSGCWLQHFVRPRRVHISKIIRKKSARKSEGSALARLPKSARAKPLQTVCHQTHRKIELPKSPASQTNSQPKEIQKSHVA